MKIRMSPCGRNRIAPSHFRLLSSQSGLTLLELVLVIIIIGLIGSAAVSRFSVIAGWRQESELRRFLNTWELLFSEAASSGDSFRLVLDISGNQYRVQQETKPVASTVQYVDHLKNLRTQGEQERRREEGENRELSLDEGFKAKDAADAGELDRMFYSHLFTDLSAEPQLTVPLAFPAMGEWTPIGGNIIIRDVKLMNDVKGDGEVFVRFTPRGGCDFAVVHLYIGEELFTAFMNPSTGDMFLAKGDFDFDWRMGREGLS